MAAFIASQREQHGVPQAVSCRALGVSQAWFYKWKGGELPPRAARRQRLKAEVARLFAAREGKDGAPRITAALRDAGWRVSENTVAGLMREQGLAARPGRKGRKHTTRQGKGRWRAPDLVKRDFPAAGINRKWYGDGTEFPTGEGKLYLDSVLDMGSRRILGHALGEHHDADLAYGALAMAAAVRGGRTAGVIFHSDQGSEYTAARFRSACGWVGRPPVDRPARLGAGQRGHRVLALHAGMGVAVPAQVRDQGRGAGRARRVDRGLQPRTQALGAGNAQPGGLRAVPGGKGRRVSAAGPLRGPGKGGGCAAAGLLAPAKGTGPPLRPKGAPHRPAGDVPCGPPLTPETTAAPGTGKAGRPRACPARARAQEGQPC